MLKKLAYIVRVLTVAPLMALVMLLVLYFGDPGFFGGTAAFIQMALFLVVLPLLAYPLQPLIKPYKEKGRDGQRTLAIIFAVAGYVLGCICALIFQAPGNVLVIYLSYLMSGGGVMLINKLLHFRASGHACGITGPFALLVYFGHTCGYFIGAPVLAVAWLSSLYMKRHTNAQFITGAVIPFCVLGLIIIVKSIFILS
jgi:hypothetical protein